MYTVLCAKRVENGILHTLGIFSVMEHAMDTHDPQLSLIIRHMTVTCQIWR